MKSDHCDAEFIKSLDANSLIENFKNQLKMKN